ncbi:hypothetical protein K8Z61_00140 [Nocardioides sp. TRM66260-LWL]|uniref:hypothetical protein n=1 Tax=Nocardioides sp. TRM66260-LWL TaxID=2874478 RepID=UPI001CC7B440|nr:hypothetical protein [Nocardioides sp. TRM66260-LWL]MBZ5732896.1 hypothetical protein [Nocardioides sp. TRM66260-LWL]
MHRTDRLISRCTDAQGRIDKRMLHARGLSDANLFGPEEQGPVLDGGLLVDASGLSVRGELDGRPFWVAVLWGGELGEGVQLRGWDAPAIGAELDLRHGEVFSLTPVGPHVALRPDDPFALLVALLELGGRDAQWQGDPPPGYPRETGCIPPLDR